MARDLSWRQVEREEFVAEFDLIDREPGALVGQSAPEGEVDPLRLPLDGRQLDAGQRQEVDRRLFPFRGDAGQPVAGWREGGEGVGRRFGEFIQGVDWLNG